MSGSCFSSKLLVEQNVTFKDFMLEFIVFLSVVQDFVSVSMQHHQAPNLYLQNTHIYNRIESSPSMRLASGRSLSLSYSSSSGFSLSGMQISYSTSVWACVHLQVWANCLISIG